MRYRQDGLNAMAGIRAKRHADCGQKRHVDTQDKPDFGSTTEWQDAFSQNVNTGTPDQVEYQCAYHVL